MSALDGARSRWVHRTLTNFFSLLLFLIFHATGPWGTGAITYDARGNITGQSLGNINTGLSYNATTGQLAAAYVAQNGIDSTSTPTYN